MSDTIAAIATAVGNSGLSVIRISGDDSINIADKIYRSKSGRFSLNDAESHTIHYGYIYDNDLLIDEVLVSVFYGPKSFTAENTVEINCHGGAFVTKKILECIIKNGARIAEPGEFTKRAFLNGRIDLSQAEAVIDVINSQNNFALNNSLYQLKGTVKNEVNELREKILHEIAFIESAIDDPEHISLDGYYDILSKKIDEISNRLELLIKNSENGSLLKNGINTVIIGKPNAGKSSLLNRLSGNDRAIVTDIAGTTRDTLTEVINLSGITLNLVDTAGVRDTDDFVEKIGVERSITEINKADLILYVADSSTVIDDNDKKILNLIKDKMVIILLNKSDLKQVIDISEFNKYIDCPIINISAKNGFGIEELENKIYELFLNKNLSYNEEVYITNVRQKNEIIDAYNSILLVKQSIDNFMPEDFLTIDMMSAYTSLGKVIGQEVSDDLADKIFAEFCMGK